MAPAPVFRGSFSHPAGRAKPLARQENLAEGEGFEPSVPVKGTTVFEFDVGRIVQCYLVLNSPENGQISAVQIPFSPSSSV